MSAPTAIKPLSNCAPFGSDLAARRNALEIRVVRSPFARAVLAGCDPSAARALPGVVAVLTAADLPGARVLDGEWSGLPVLAEREILHHGQAVALVAALTREAADLGAEALRIDYQPLPPVLGLEEAVAMRAFHGDTVLAERGDAAGALKSGAKTLSHTFEMSGQERGLPEPGWAQAEPDGSGGLHILSPCALSGSLHAALSAVLGLPMNALRISSPVRSACPASDPLPTLHAALIAHHSGRPATVRLSPGEQRVLAPRKPGMRAVCEAAFDARGSIAALDMTLFIDAGCAPAGGEALMAGVLHHLDGVYELPAVRLAVRLCRSNFPPRSSGMGDLAARAQLVVEDMMARIARDLGLLPEIVRQRNLLAPTPADGMSGDERSAVGGVPANAEALVALWKHSLKQSDFAARRKEIDHSNARNPLVKRGLSATPAKIALGDARSGPVSSSAFLQIYPDGSACVFSDANSPALREAVIECVVSEIGIRPDAVSVVPPVSDRGCADLSVLAASDAAQNLRRELLPLVMRIFHENGATGVRPENLQFTPGRIADRVDPNLGFPFESLVAFALAQGFGLTSTGSAGVHHSGLPFHGYLFGTSVSEVEVDSFTGEARILRSDLYHEAATASPNVRKAHADLRSAFMEGVGWLSSEAEASAGQPLSPPMVPGLDEEPLDLRIKLVEAADRDGDPAPGGHALALSVREALRDAIAAFGGTGSTKIIDLPVPATPEAVYRLIQQQRAAAVSPS